MSGSHPKRRPGRPIDPSSRRIEHHFGPGDLTAVFSQPVRGTALINTAEVRSTSSRRPRNELQARQNRVLRTDDRGVAVVHHLQRSRPTRIDPKPVPGSRDHQYLCGAARPGRRAIDNASNRPPWSVGGSFAPRRTPRIGFPRWPGFAVEPLPSLSPPEWRAGCRRKVAAWHSQGSHGHQN